MPEGLMNRLSEDAVKLLYTEARTFSAWLPQEVPDDLLHQLYDLMKHGPTSANTCPARIVFVKSAAAKARLLPGVLDMNVEKVKAAPVTAIFAMDERFYDKIPTLFPVAPQYKDTFAANPDLAAVTAMRNSSLQGGYFILAARAVGLDCGPMSGFNNAKVDEAFLSGTSWRSNFICNLGYGDRSQLHPRLPRLPFDEACRIE